MSIVFDKTLDPNEVKDYTADWSDELLPGDSIVTSTWTLSARAVSEGVVKSSETNTATEARLFLSGGVPGTDYGVKNKITTTLLKTRERTYILRVRDK